MPRPRCLDSQLQTERRSCPGKRILFGRLLLQQIAEQQPAKSSQRATRSAPWRIASLCGHGQRRVIGERCQQRQADAGGYKIRHQQ